MAQNILDANVASAAPATPRCNPQISKAFPAIFIPLEIVEITIGVLVFFWARKILEPALYRAINGKDNAIKKKYIWAAAITPGSIEPKITRNNGFRNTIHNIVSVTEIKVTVKTTWLAALFAAFSSFRPIYW